jgi:hypothetical protein
VFTFVKLFVAAQKKIPEDFVAAQIIIFNSCVYFLAAKIVVLVAIQF